LNKTKKFLQLKWVKACCFEASLSLCYDDKIILFLKFTNEINLLLHLLQSCSENGGKCEQ